MIGIQKPVEEAVRDCERADFAEGLQASKQKRAEMLEIFPRER